MCSIPLKSDICLILSSSGQNKLELRLAMLDHDSELKKNVEKFLYRDAYLSFRHRKHDWLYPQGSMTYCWANVCWDEDIPHIGYLASILRELELTEFIFILKEEDLPYAVSKGKLMDPTDPEFAKTIHFLVSSIKYISPTSDNGVYLDKIDDIYRRI